MSKYHLQSIKKDIEKYKKNRENSSDQHSIYYVRFQQQHFLTRYMTSCSKLVDNIDMLAVDCGQKVFTVLRKFVFINNLEGSESDDDLFANMLCLETLNNRFSKDNIKNQILFVPATKLDMVGSRNSAKQAILSGLESETLANLNDTFNKDGIVKFEIGGGIVYFYQCSKQYYDNTKQAPFIFLSKIAEAIEHLKKFQ
jgi:hypothetical protein